MWASGGGAQSAKNLFGLPSAHDAPGDGTDLAHRASEELRAAADLMQDAQRVANFGSWEWRLADDEVFWSDQLYRIFGIEPGRTRTPFRETFATYLERVHPDEQVEVRKKIEAALGDANPFRFEHRIVRPDGEIRNVRCQGEPVFDPATREMFALSASVRTSPRWRRSSAPARRPTRAFASAFENAPIGIALVDFRKDGRPPDRGEQGACDLTGRKGDELIGSKLTGLCLAEDAPVDEALRERLVAGEIERFTVEKRALMPDDRLVWLELSVSTVPNDGPCAPPESCRSRT